VSSTGRHVNTDRILATALGESKDFGIGDLDYAFEIVALAYALPGLASEIPGEVWWKLAEQLHKLATDAEQQGVDWPADPYDILRQQLVAGELPLVLSYSFPELRAFRALRESARSALSDGLLELTDGHGLPHGRLLPVLGALFALWTRTRWLGEWLKRGCWSSAAELQYEWLVRNALRLVDGNGNFMLAACRDEESPASLKELFACALELVGRKDQCTIAAATFSGRVGRTRVNYDAVDLPEPSLESEWSGICVLASGWSRMATRLAIAFADDPLHIELTLGCEQFLAGSWNSHTVCDGVPAIVDGEWQELCWLTGKRYDLLELGVDLSGGLRLERQLLLARDDCVLYLADIVFAHDDEPHKLQHSVRLPLGPDVVCELEPETRDVVLVCGKRPMAVLPLGLNEWRCDPRGGSLVAEADNLILNQDSFGRALYCPLLLDLKPRRSKRDRTWRQLTVAESLEIVPRDVAVGFRAQSGRDQWLFYRSLGRPGNRTLLGQNISGEFAAGRFLPSGKMKQWVEIEAE
jgi:hypothetical protein